MDWRIFAGTFGLIFLAELGDKTQLAAMAASAGTSSPFSIFAGAASALILSTLIAVIAGSYLQQWLPIHIIQYAAALLFFAFGAFLLFSAVRGPDATAAQPLSNTAAESMQGPLSHAALNAALTFEHATAAHYDDAARATSSATLRTLYQSLAGQEREHVRTLHRLSDQHESHGTGTKTAASDVPSQLPPGLHLSDADSEVLDAARQHEEKTAEFYEALARHAHIPGMRNSFTYLAQQERAHAARLANALYSHSTYQAGNDAKA